jgi:putative addiction module killer protein
LSGVALLSNGARQVDLRIWAIDKLQGAVLAVGFVASLVVRDQVSEIVIERLQSSMIEVKTTAEFDDWMRGLRDGLTRRRLAARLRKVSFGLLGDVQPVGGGVMEMREHFGPGWRMYYLQHASIMIVMLGGGDKSSQSGDIAKAQTLAQQLE